MLATEWVEARDANVKVRQRHRYCGVAHVLTQVCRGAQRHADARERGAPVDGRRTCRLRQRLRIVHACQVVALIARRGEVDTR